MSDAIHIWKYLERRPQSAYRQLFVKGTRIRARVLYGYLMSSDEPTTPESLAEQFNLPVEAVREAVAYCQSNPPEIAEDFAREEALEEAAGMKDPDYAKTGRRRALTPSELHRILRS